MNHRHLLLCLFASLGSLLSSCVSGPTYEESKNSAALTPAKGKGLVLIYWEGGFVGKATKWNVYANGQELTNRMRRGAFCSYQANPGPLKLQTKMGWNWASIVGLNLLNQIKHDQPVVHISPNQTYFMEMGYGAWREKISLVSASEAKEVIDYCSWINPPRS